MSTIARRTLLKIAAASTLGPTGGLPTYRVQSRFRGAPHQGMPGPLPGIVKRVQAANCIDAASESVDADVVRQMLSAGMRALTGAANDRDAWTRFITPADVVGIKVNCSGAPHVMSTPEVVSGIVANLLAVGVPAASIYVYERFQDQMKSVRYEDHLPAGTHVTAAEASYGSILGYDPYTYVEVNFFGEDDTRSCLTRLVSDRFTKIINVPNMKEHQASGVTGCLKNIAYGNFSNVARSHRFEKTNTYSFIGALASVEPLRSRTVLHIMDGLRGVWHGGPFSENARFRFFPKQLLFGTDPVAMDRVLIDVIEEKRKAEHAPSIFDRAPERIRREGELDPNFNAFLREPGHVEYAAKLGLGVYDRAAIQLETIEL